MIGLIEKTIEESMITIDKISSIVLTGGSLRIPKLVNMIESNFKKPIKTAINPLETVVRGNTLLAISLYNQTQSFFVCGLAFTRFDYGI